MGGAGGIKKINDKILGHANCIYSQNVKRDLNPLHSVPHTRARCYRCWQPQFIDKPLPVHAYAHERVVPRPHPTREGWGLGTRLKYSIPIDTRTCTTGIISYL